MKRAGRGLSHPEQAMAPLNRELQDYLDQLLREASVDAASPAPDTHAEPQAGESRPPAPRRSEIAVERPYAEPQLRLAPHLPPIAPPVAEPGGAVETDTEAEPLRPTVAAEPIVDRIHAAGEQMAVAAPAAPTVQSAWRDAAFEALLFRAGGLTLAVPLTLLGAIRPLDEAPTPLFGQARWFMGMLPNKEGTLRIVDTAQVIMEERYRAEMRAGYRYVISLHGSDWALAVDEIGDAVTLQPNHIRWRSPSGKRPWLAGTVVEQMCALLDVRGLDTVLGRS